MIWPLKEKTAPQDAQYPTLNTDRLTLRPAVGGDYAQWKKVRTRNRAYLEPFEPEWPQNCLDQKFFLRRVLRLQEDWRQDKGYAFLIFEKDSQTLLGGININNVTRGAAQYASLGYWLDQFSQGQGYMTEAAHAVLTCAFSELHLARINAGTLPHNHKSRAMLERVGFIEEGFAKAYIQIHGKRQDHVLYGLNADDFLCAS